VYSQLSLAYASLRQCLQHIGQQQIQELHAWQPSLHHQTQASDTAAAAAAAAQQQQWFILLPLS
jgi:hypothetical protein